MSQAAVTFSVEYNKKGCIQRYSPLRVEIPGFEPGQTEPKSVVLPLHHISITCILEECRLQRYCFFE